MNDQQVQEIIKAFAYGKTAEEVEKAEGISEEDAISILCRHAAEIKKLQQELKEGGYINGD